MLDTAKATIGGLPIAGPILGGLLNNLNVNPGSGIPLDQLQALLGTATGVPGQGLSIIANLGGGKVLTSAGTVIQLGQGVAADPTSAPGSVLGAAGNAAGGIFANLPTGAGDTAAGVASIPINTAQGVIHIPLSVLQILLGTAKDTAGGPAGTATGALGGAAGTLVDVGGQLLPLSEVLGLISGATSNAPVNPFDLVGLSTGDADDWADAYSMDNSTMSNSTMTNSTNPTSSAYPSETGTPTAAELVTSMIARQLPVSPSDVAGKLPVKPSDVAGKLAVAPSAVAGELPVSPTGVTSSIGAKLPNGVPDPTSMAGALPTPSHPALPAKPMEAEDDGDWDDDDAETESWGDFVEGP